jgi:hypothetical protein
MMAAERWPARKEPADNQFFLHVGVPLSVR